MRIAFVIFEGMTALDFIGVYDPLTRLKTMGFMPELTFEVCACTEHVRDSTGLLFTASRVAQPLDGYDLVVVPGGLSTRQLVRDTKFMEWIGTAQGSKVVATVCSGSLLIGALGMLRNKKATTHPSAYDLLRPHCAEVVTRRIVDEGTVVTARGVSSALDLGLYLCERYAGSKVRECIRLQMDYLTESS